MFGIFRRDEDRPEQSAPVDDLVSLHADLEELRIRVAAAGRSLPADAHVMTGLIAAVTRRILARASHLTPTSDELQVVVRTVRDYLPTTIERYLALPAGYASRTLPNSTQTASEALVEQLRILERELEQTLEMFHNADAKAFADQGRFLEDRFHRSSLDF